MRVLALDLATSTGWAVADMESYRPLTAIELAGVAPVPKPRSGVYAIPKAKRDDLGAFLDAFDEWLGGLFAMAEPTFVAFEAPWVGPKTHQDTAHKLLNLAGQVELRCYRSDFVKRYFKANNSRVRAHFIGPGRGKRAEIKAKTIAECNARGWQVESDDEADALALLDYAMHCLAPRRAA